MGAADRNREAADSADRRRIAQAVADLAHERTLSAARADDLCRRADIPRREFDRLFSSVEEALRHAFAEAFATLFGPVREAVASAPTWLNGLARALDTLVRVAGEQRRPTALCLIHSTGAPEASAGHDYRSAVETMIALLHPARVHAEADPEATMTAPPLAEEFLAHGILFLAGQIAQQDEPPTPSGRDGELLMLVLMTFYGTADATRMCREVEA